MPYRPNDHYARKARKEQYNARSVYKLEEMDKKHHLFRRGQTVLDLGCAPGSWSQYISKRVGSSGRILGIDLSAVELGLPNVVTLQADIYEADIAALAETHNIRLPFNLIVSDMAPRTTGSKGTDKAQSAALCEMALHLAQTGLLRKGGDFVVKMFEGPDTQPFRKTLLENFTKVATARPKSTRKSSKEIFLLGIGYKDAANR